MGAGCPPDTQSPPAEGVNESRGKAGKRKKKNEESHSKPNKRGERMIPDQHDGLNMVYVCGKVLVCINHTVVQVMLPAAIINRCTMYRYKYQNIYSITSIV